MHEAWECPRLGIVRDLGTGEFCERVSLGSASALGMREVLRWPENAEGSGVATGAHALL